MKRSTDRIITTQVSSLPRPNDLRQLWDDRLAKRPGYTREAFDARVKTAVAEMVQQQTRLWHRRRQRRRDGSHRLDRTSCRSASTGSRTGQWAVRGTATIASREVEKGLFNSYLAERQRLTASGEGREFQPSAEARQALRVQMVASGEISHKGFGPINQEIGYFKDALAQTPVLEGFMASVGPDNMGYQPGQMEYYSHQDDFLRACAAAIRNEYKAIIDAGLVLQIDTPVMKFVALDMDVPTFRKRFGLLVEVFNETLKGLPSDMIRLHLCYGGGRGPHSEDVGLNEFLDLILQVNADGLSFDQNPRHEWEWEILKDVKLPDGKVLIPGCVGHTNDVIEHPNLVRQRIVRLANLVGRENVIASSDCGFAQSVFGPKIDPDLVWAKFRALSEGAALATKELWKN